jgi:hypothetical protein
VAFGHGRVDIGLDRDMSHMVLGGRANSLVWTGPAECRKVPIRTVKMLYFFLDGKDGLDEDGKC